MVFGTRAADPALVEWASRGIGRPVGPFLGPFCLNVTVLGFEQNLEFGMLGCAQTMPDLATLRDYLKEQATTLIATFNE